MTIVRTLEFSKLLSEAYDKFDLKKVYELTRDFAALDVADFYLDFTKYRRRRLVESHIQALVKNDDSNDESNSSLFVMH
jgi:isoleucyl-tRNA synthetase